MAESDQLEEYRLRDAGTLRHLERLQLAFPTARRQREALWVLKSDFSYAASWDGRLWLGLVRFGRNIERRFGITNEVLILYVPYYDLQPRILSALDAYKSSLPAGRLADKQLLLIHCPDPDADAKLESWSPSLGFSAVRLSSVGTIEEIAERLIAGLVSRLSSRNLYEESLAVTGMDFYGREDILRQLIFELRQRNVCGVFGLRKSGKTSIIKELGRRFQGEDSGARIFVLRDMETLPTDPSLVEARLISDLRASFLVGFRERGIRTHELANLDSNEIGPFRRALEASLSDCRHRQVQVVLALDEVESLVGDAKALASEDRAYVPEFLGAIRSLVQEYDNFNAILAGITDATVERGQLYGRENPLFSWAKPFYVGGMKPDEIERLTVQIGSRMALRWSSSAHTVMHETCRGNIFLHRTLAAEVSTSDSVSRSRVVTAEDVASAIPRWQRKIVPRVREMIASTRRHYPVEVEMLETFASDPATFTELSNYYLDEINHLYELDLLRDEATGTILGPLPQLLSQFQQL